MVVSPLVAQLSDRFGRRHFGSWGRIGWIIFFSGHRIRDRSLTHRLWFEAIPWGIIQAGTWPVFAAAHSDVFGERPQLSARIKSRDGMYISIAGVCGPIVTVLVSRTVGLAATEHLCSVLAAASIVLQLANKETLTPAKRKPFSLSQANPFANVHLLFTNGPGLRRLASSTSLWFWCNEIWSTQAAFRMGVLRWTPIQTGIFDCIYHLTETVAHKPLVGAHDHLHDASREKLVFTPTLFQTPSSKPAPTAPPSRSARCSRRWPTSSSPSRGGRPPAPPPSCG